MTRTYEELLSETLPARIETDAEYDALSARFHELFGRRDLTAAERKLKDLLGVLIQDYDHRHKMPPEKVTPAEILEFFVEQSGKSASELLSPIFGTRSHVSEALSGKRPISADQARKLGKMFRVNAGLFI